MKNEQIMQWAKMINEEQLGEVSNIDVDWDDKTLLGKYEDDVTDFIQVLKNTEKSTLEETIRQLSIYTPDEDIKKLIEVQKRYLNSTKDEKYRKVLDVLEMMYRNKRTLGNLIDLRITKDKEGI